MTAPDLIPGAVLAFNRGAFAMNDTHPVVVLAGFTVLTCTVLLLSLTFANWSDKPLLPTLTAPFAQHEYTMAAVEASPILAPYLNDFTSPPRAVWCDATQRWRHPVTKRFVRVAD